jgi:hypothetical protein
VVEYHKVVRDFKMSGLRPDGCYTMHLLSQLSVVTAKRFEKVPSPLDLGVESVDSVSDNFL